MQRARYFCLVCRRAECNAIMYTNEFKHDEYEYALHGRCYWCWRIFEVFLEKEEEIPNIFSWYFHHLTVETNSNSINVLMAMVFYLFRNLRSHTGAHVYFVLFCPIHTIQSSYATNNWHTTQNSANMLEFHDVVYCIRSWINFSGSKSYDISHFILKLNMSKKMAGEWQWQHSR